MARIGPCLWASRHRDWHRGRVVYDLSMLTAGTQLAIVEAAYRVDLSDSEWLEGIARACVSSLARGFGLCAFEFRHRSGERPEILGCTMLSIPKDLAAAYPSIFKSMDPEVQTRPFAHGPCTTASRMMGGAKQLEHNTLMQRQAHRFGIQDSIWITAAEPSGWGCGLHAGRGEPTSLSRNDVERWSRIASHVGAAVRLRRRLRRDAATETPNLSPADALFSPEGRVEHAQGDARQSQVLERLRTAVLSIERTRSMPQSSEPDENFGLWPGLVDARWSLLDAFETDGRRYIVARENTPDPPGPSALTLRERQVVSYAALGHDNKVIAYDLGIAHSTVRVLMARAAAKFRVGSREQLIEAYEACLAPRAHRVSRSADTTIEHDD